MYDFHLQMGGDTVLVKRPASKVTQGNLVLYATSLRVRDLREKGFYKIEELDSEDRVGYQRILDERRAKQLADYLLEANEEGEAFLPTSIFLATDKQLAFDEGAHLLSIDVAKTGPFNVVDGQHRIRGLVLAAEKDPSMDEFEVPVNIAVGLDSISQMCHFLIVNTTQKSVDQAIAQQIVARLTDMIDFEKTPVLPKWIQRQVDKKEDHRALAIVTYLNTHDDSPWHGRVLMANSEDESGAAAVSQKSFVKNLKKHILVPSNPISTWPIERQQKVLANYWSAISELLVDPENKAKSVVFKSNGMHLFHMLSPTVFLHLQNLRDFKREAFKSVLNHGFQHLTGEYLGMSSPQFWQRGGTASGLNQAAMRKYAQALSAAINTTGDSGDVQL